MSGRGPYGAGRPEGRAVGGLVKRGERGSVRITSRGGCIQVDSEIVVRYPLTEREAFADSDCVWRYHRGPSRRMRARIIAAVILALIVVGYGGRGGGRQGVGRPAPGLLAMSGLAAFGSAYYLLFGPATLRWLSQYQFRKSGLAGSEIEWIID